jgi:hypothetical protein
LFEIVLAINQTPPIILDMSLPATFKADKTEYLDARSTYRNICQQSEVSRDAAVQLRQARFDAHKRVIESAENLLMSVQGLHRSHLSALGLWEMYQELTAGNGSPVVLLKLADETAKL